MAGDRSQPSQTAEQTEERTVSSGNLLTSDDPRFVSGSTVDEVVDTAEQLRQAVDDLPSGSSILFDEAGSSISSRRGAAALGEDYANRRTVPTNRTGGNPFDDSGLGTSIGDPLDFTRSPSNRDLEKKLNAYGRRLKRVEEKLDDVLDALDVEQRPVGEVLQDVLDDELSQREAADELGWSAAKVSQVVNQIHE